MLEYNGKFDLHETIIPKRHGGFSHKWGKLDYITPATPQTK